MLRFIVMSPSPIRLLSLKSCSIISRYGTETNLAQKLVGERRKDSFVYIRRLYALHWIVTDSRRVLGGNSLPFIMAPKLRADLVHRELNLCKDYVALC